MRRLGRILLNALTVLSLLLFVATVALWVRGYFVQDYVEVRENYRKPATNPTNPPKFEFRDVRTTWDSTWGRIRYSSADHLTGTYTAAQAAAARWRATRNVSRGRVTPQRRDNDKWVRTGPEGAWNRLGFFAWRGQDRRGRTRFVVYGTPYWAPALALAVMPTWRTLRAVRRWRRSSRSLCPSCGYDLRATPERCPECGSTSVANNSSTTG